MIVDRFSISNENTTNLLFISFVHPHENISQEYELHKPSLLPKAIPKCQGNQ